MPRQANAHVSPVMLRKRMLQDEIVKLRRQRLSWRKIGEEVGLSHEYARRLFDAAMTDAAEHMQSQPAGGHGEPGVDSGRGSSSQALRKQELVEEVLRLRRQGFSYRAIAIEMRRGKDQVRRLAESGFAEVMEGTRNLAVVTLCEQLERMDYLIRASSLVLESPDATTAERLRAISQIGRASETKMRWLGADGSKPFVEVRIGRAALAEKEVAELSDEGLDKELAAFGYHKGPVVDQEAGAAHPDRAGSSR